MLLVFIGYAKLIAEPAARADADAALQNLSRSGLATTQREYNKKYPSTREGGWAVQQAAAAALLFDVDLVDVRRTTATADIAPEPVRGFDFGENNGSGYSTEDVSLARLQRLNDFSTRTMDIIMGLPAVAPYEDISWRLNISQTSPIVPGTRVAGLIFRELFRVPLTTAIYLALRDGDDSRAWRTAVGFGYLARCYRVQATDTVGAMIGVAITGIWIWDVMSLLEAAPPDRDTALHAAVVAWPEIMQDDFIRACEAALIVELAAIKGATDPTVNLHSDLLEFRPFGQNSRGPRWVGPWHAVFAVELEKVRHFSAKCLILMRDLLNARDKQKTNGILRRMGGLELTGIEALVAEDLNVPVVNVLAIGILNARGRWTQASILRAALLMRAREIDTGGDPAQLPKSLDDLCAAYGVAPLLDYLGDTPDARLIYTPNPATGKFTITHKPNIDPTYVGGTPYVYEGQWGGVSTPADMP